jgi:RNA polymerase sigma-70 factor (ECF subfamily)
MRTGAQGTRAAADLRRELVALVPQLRAFARFLARDADAADELVQDTIARALAAAPPTGDSRSWSFAILRNRFYEVTRRRKRSAERFSPLPAEAVEAAAAAPGAQEARHAARDLRRAVWQLPREQREALALVVSGVPVAEAARICGCREGTIKSRVARARASLAALTGGETGG